MLTNLKKIIGSFLIKIGFIKPFEYKLEFVPDHPVKDRLLSKYIFIVGGKGYQKWAYLRCPCGCNERIMLCLSKNKKPSWSIKIDFGGRVSFYPSIRQLSGCKSHFWINKGITSWCFDSVGTMNLSKKGINNEYEEHTIL